VHPVLFFLGLQQIVGVDVLEPDEDALAAGTTLTSGGLAIRLADPDEVRSPPRQTVA